MIAQSLEDMARHGRMDSETPALEKISSSWIDAVFGLPSKIGLGIKKMPAVRMVRSRSPGDGPLRDMRKAQQASCVMVWLAPLHRAVEP